MNSLYTYLEEQMKNVEQMSYGNQKSQSDLMLKMHSDISLFYAAQKKDIQTKLESLKTNCALVLEKTMEVLEQGQEQINSKSLDQPKATRLETHESTDYLPF